MSRKKSLFQIMYYHVFQIMYYHVIQQAFYLHQLHNIKKPEKRFSKTNSLAVPSVMYLYPVIL